MNLKRLELEVHHKKNRMLGFPLDLSGELPVKELFAFLEGVTLNNLGDPYIGGNYGLNTFKEEREIVYEFANLFGLGNKSHWGYVTNSGTEGNLAGIAEGLAQHPDAVVYASDKAHYSIDKACRLMRAPLVKIKSLPHGKIDFGQVCKMVNPNRPSIGVLTAGTTMSGAIDEIVSASVFNYTHVDAALSGLILPFLDSTPAFDFRCEIDSISVSGHKMLGVPVPCGVFLSRHQPAPPTIDYIGSKDSTIGGSRSGWAVLAIWYALHYFGPEGLRRRARYCVLQSVLAEQKLKEIGWPCWRNDHSSTVVLKKPHRSIVEKWQLAVDSEEAHVICMPHVTSEMIGEFVADLKLSPES